MHDENLTIRVADKLTLKAHCGSCVWDIVTISVLSGVLLIKDNYWKWDKVIWYDLGGQRSLFEKDAQFH